MAKKKKTKTIGQISAIELIDKSRPIQDIPFRTGVYKDKRKKREYNYIRRNYYHI